MACSCGLIFTPHIEYEQIETHITKKYHSHIQNLIWLLSFTLHRSVLPSLPPLTYNHNPEMGPGLPVSWCSHQYTTLLCHLLGDEN